MVNLIITLLLMAVCFYLGIIYVNTGILTVGYAMGILIIVSLAEVIYHYFYVRYQLEIPISMAEKGMPLEVMVKVKNDSSIPVGGIKVHTTMKNSLRKQGESQWIFLPATLNNNDRRSFSMTLEEAGYFSVGVDRIRVYSLTGMFYVNLRCKEEAFCLMLPEVQALSIDVSEGTKNLRGNADVPDDFRIGADFSENFEIREYRPKDKLQNIHWKLSAKANELMVKEISLPKPCSVVLMLDLRKNGEKDFCVNGFLKLVASISFSIMDAKCPHFVTWISRETEDVKRIRVDDEESFYLFLNHALQDMIGGTTKDIRREYREKYRNEIYLHDLCITAGLELYKDGELVNKWTKKNVEDECEKLELLL